MLAAALKPRLEDSRTIRDALSLANAIEFPILRNPFSFLATQPLPAGFLRESVLHRYAQYCNLVRERLLIDQ